MNAIRFPPTGVKVDFLLHVKEMPRLDNLDHKLVEHAHHGSHNWKIKNPSPDHRKGNTRSIFLS